MDGPSLASGPDGASSAVRPVVDDCWNRIGVRGDRSCSVLPEHVHCRNCPVFASAARGLLDRPVPAEYLEVWSRHFAETKAEEARVTRSAVVFRLGPEWFALPTEVFDEVTANRRVHALPHQRNPAVLGLVNVRGELIICVSLHRMLGVEPAAGGEADHGMARARLIVVRHGSGPVAIPVDEVQPIIRFDERSLKNVPRTIVRAGSNYTSGLLPWREREIGYLDAERIVPAINRSLA